MEKPYKFSPHWNLVSFHVNSDTSFSRQVSKFWQKLPNLITNLIKRKILLKSKMESFFKGWWRAFILLFSDPFIGNGGRERKKKDISLSWSFFFLPSLLSFGKKEKEKRRRSEKSRNAGIYPFQKIYTTRVLYHVNLWRGGMVKLGEVYI